METVTPMDTTINVLLGVNIVTLLAVLGFGYKVMRFIHLLEFRVNMMWDDYEDRTGKTHVHRRSQDE